MRLSFELDFEAYLKTTQNLAYVAASPRVVKTICTEGLRVSAKRQFSAFPWRPNVDRSSMVFIVVLRSD